MRTFFLKDFLQFLLVLVFFNLYFFFIMVYLIIQRSITLYFFFLEFIIIGWRRNINICKRRWMVKVFYFFRIEYSGMQLEPTRPSDFIFSCPPFSNKPLLPHKRMYTSIIKQGCEKEKKKGSKLWIYLYFCKSITCYIYVYGTIWDFCYSFFSKTLRERRTVMITTFR